MWLDNEKLEVLIEKQIEMIPSGCEETQKLAEETIKLWPIKDLAKILEVDVFLKDPELVDEFHNLWTYNVHTRVFEVFVTGHRGQKGKRVVASPADYVRPVERMYIGN